MKLLGRKPYPTDVSNAQWEKIGPRLPPPASRGAPRRVDLREIWNALAYVNRSGCQWRMLPHDFPDWQVVYDYFRAWRDDGTFERLNRELRIELRIRLQRDEEPSAAMLDSQTVKSTAMSEVRGFDSGKRVNGVKRHALVDVNGFLLSLMILPGNIQDPAGARQFLASVWSMFPRIKKIWADGIYGGTLIEWVWQTCGWVLEIVKRTDKQVGFRPLPRRWVIERFFGWLNWDRRLSKHYERRTDSAVAMVYLASVRLMSKRLAGPATVFACRA